LANGPVLCIGECLIDLITEGGGDLLSADRFAIREGGAPMNVAVALARLGVPSGFCGVVGADPFGERIRTLLDGEGVDIATLRMTSEADTSLALAWRDPRGDGAFRILRMADRLLTPEDVEQAGIPSATAIVVGSVALAASPSRQAVERALAISAEYQVPVVVDVNVRPSLWTDRAALRAACEPLFAAATVVKMSLDDARELWGTATHEDVIDALRNRPSRLNVITDGERGVAVHDRATATVRRVPVFPVRAVDPTGAGDAFTAALISRLIAKGWQSPDQDDLTFAIAAGAITTTQPGALAALPTREAIEAFLSA
jgi:fructokinase